MGVKFQSRIVEKTSTEIATTIVWIGTREEMLQLQRDTPIRVWGTGKSGEKVEVAFGGATVRGKVGGNGRWKLELPPAKASAAGAVLTVKGDDGTKTFRNVLVGDIWLCSGQSNMQWVLKNITGAAEVVAAADNPPPHLPVGKDAVQALDTYCQTIQRNVNAWRDKATQTAYEKEEL